jgi:hypothetical protein
MMLKIAHLLAAAVLTQTAGAGTLLVYTSTETGNGSTFYHNDTKPMIVRKEKATNISFVVRDIDAREESTIATLVENKVKKYILPLQLPNDFSSVIANSYEQASRFFSFENNQLAGRPMAGVECKNTYVNSGGRATSLSNVGRDDVFALAAPSALPVGFPLSIKAPKSFTTTGRAIWERDVTETSTERPLWPHTGAAVTSLGYTGGLKLSLPYSVAVNKPNPADTATPAGLVPGTLPYAMYRLGTLLQAAKYLPKQ